MEKFLKIIKIVKINSLKLFSFIFLISLFWGNFSYSLDFRDKLQSKILFVSPQKNRVIINRGLQDGLQIEESGRFILDKKFLFYGVCVALEENFSEWVVQRTYARDMIQNDTDVIFRSLYGQKKPKYSNLNFIQSRSYMSDLREDHKKLKSFQKEKDQDEKKSILFKQYALQRYQDFILPNMNAEIFMAPIIIKSPAYQTTWDFGFKAISVPNKDYSLEINYHYQNITWKEYRGGRKSNQTNQRFSLIREGLDDNLNSPTSYLSKIHFQNQSDANFQIIRRQIFLSPFGIKYNFKNQNEKQIPKLYLFYLPTFELFSADTNRAEKFQEIEKTDNSIRHGLGFGINFKLSENLKLLSDTQLLPKLSFNHYLFDFDSSLIFHSLKLNYEIYKSFSLSLEQNLYRDPRRDEWQNIPSNEWTTSIRIHYQFDIKDLFF
jgi:hypothetical protein